MSKFDVMDWVNRLTADQWREVNILQNERAAAVYKCDTGKITADEARAIVARCNHEIARIAEGAA